jgi:hypothetical protein
LLGSPAMSVAAHMHALRCRTGTANEPPSSIPDVQKALEKGVVRNRKGVVGG